MWVRLLATIHAADVEELRQSRCMSPCWRTGYSLWRSGFTARKADEPMKWRNCHAEAGGEPLYLGRRGLVWWMQVADGRRELEVLPDLLAALGEMGEEIRMTRTPLPPAAGQALPGPDGGGDRFLLRTCQCRPAGRECVPGLAGRRRETPPGCGGPEDNGGGRRSPDRGRSPRFAGTLPAQARISRSLEEKPQPAAGTGAAGDGLELFPPRRCW